MVKNSRQAEQNDSDQSREARISAAAKRALEEAEARAMSAREKLLPKELGGRDGPEATRYGDWEKKGIAVDF